MLYTKPNRFVYFDNAASAKPYDQVIDLAGEVAKELFANPGSIHDFGNACNRWIDKSRKSILKCLLPESLRNAFEVVFASGATEANNIAVLGSAQAKAAFSRRLITTTAEHSSVSNVFAKLEREGFEVIRIRVGADGDIDWPAYEAALAKPVGLVSAMEVCNQNGAILPVAKMAAMAKAKQPRAIFHTDATQSVGKIDSDFSSVDLISFSGHKVGALRGSGALLKRKGVAIVPPEVGGGQEDGLRSGTLNAPGDIGLGLALELDKANLAQRTACAKAVNDAIREGLKGTEDLVEVLSPMDSCIPFVLALGLKAQRASVMDQFLSGEGIFVSTTSACDDRKQEPNAILRAMGFEPHVADNPIRLSFNGTETLEDAKAFLAAFKTGLGTLKHDS